MGAYSSTYSTTVSDSCSLPTTKGGFLIFHPPSPAPTALCGRPFHPLHAHGPGSPLLALFAPGPQLARVALLSLDPKIPVVALNKEGGKMHDGG